jgi:hypothetical protein
MTHLVRVAPLPGHFVEHHTRGVDPVPSSRWSYTRTVGARRRRCRRRGLTRGTPPRAAASPAARSGRRPRRPPPRAFSNWAEMGSLNVLGWGQTYVHSLRRYNTRFAPAERSCHGSQKALSFSVALASLIALSLPATRLHPFPRSQAWNSSRSVLPYIAPVAWTNGGGAGEEG